jgi:hypothetical protein
MAANVHHGKVVAAAICLHAAATAHDVVAISLAAAGSPLRDRAVISQARPYCRYAASQARVVLSVTITPPEETDPRGASLCDGPDTGRAVGRPSRPVSRTRANPRELAGAHGEAHAALLGCSVLPAVPVCLVDCDARVPVALAAAVNPVAR